MYPFPGSWDFNSETHWLQAFENWATVQNPVDIPWNPDWSIGIPLMAYYNPRSRRHGARCRVPAVSRFQNNMSPSSNFFIVGPKAKTCTAFACKPQNRNGLCPATTQGKVTCVPNCFVGTKNRFVSQSSNKTMKDWLILVHTAGSQRCTLECLQAKNIILTYVRSVFQCANVRQFVFVYRARSKARTSDRNK